MTADHNNRSKNLNGEVPQPCAGLRSVNGPLLGFYFLGLLLVHSLFYLSIATGAQQTADADTMSPDEILVFFKATLGNPQDVEHFIVGKQTLWERPVQPEAQKYIKPPSTNDYREMFFEGARSGSNYFIRQIARPTPQASATTGGLFAGRSGTNSYQIGPNAVTFTGEDAKRTPNNPIASQASTFQLIVDQFLGVGLPAIEPGTMKWEGVRFRGKNEHGWTVTGELALSNQLPASLTVAYGENGTPSKLMHFSYPSPPDLLEGFPSRITICIPDGGVMKPWQLLNFYEISQATDLLSAEVFAASRHLGTNVVYTNIHSGGKLYSIAAGNRLVPVSSVPGAIHSRPTDFNGRRAAVIICLCVITAVPMLWSLWRLKRNKRT